MPSVFGYCVGPPGQKNHVVPIQEECFWHIMQKRKTVEGLIAKGAMLNVFPGELLRFECGCQHLDVKVLAMVKYMSFREMLENEGLMNCLPNCADIDSGTANATEKQKKIERASKKNLRVVLKFFLKFFL